MVVPIGLLYWCCGETVILTLATHGDTMELVECLGGCVVIHWHISSMHPQGCGISVHVHVFGKLEYLLNALFLA